MKEIVVTGSSKGLGLAITKKLLENNYVVIGISRSKSKEFEQLENDFADKLFYEQYDFDDVENISNLAKKIGVTHKNIYGLINNAALGFDGILGTMHDSQIAELLRVNIQAPILLTKYISRMMLLKMSGRIINIGSIIGSTGFNGLSVYGASKASMQGFTKSLARELGKAKITVNTIAPGYMQTQMTNKLQGDKLASIVRRSPLGHLVDVDDVANSVLFLLSDEAKNITGTTMVVDAGSIA